MTLLEQVKALLGITGTDKDALLNLLCGSVTAQVKTYCRISDVSDAGLQGLIADMTVTRYRARGYGKESTPKMLSKLTEGDVSFTFEAVQYDTTGELTDAEKKALCPYRKLWP
jgi:hypothetical protein